MTFLLSSPFEGNAAQSSATFQCGDKVRTIHGSGVMNVIVAFGDQVHCEWLIGTEPHQREFPASSLLLVQRARAPL